MSTKLAVPKSKPVGPAPAGGPVGRAADMPADPRGLDQHSPVWIWIVAGGLGLAALVSPTLWRLWALWQIDPNYSHGPLVPPAALAFAWLAWRRDPQAGSSRPEPVAISRGFALTTGGLLLHVAAWLSNQMFAAVFGLVLVLWGIAFVLGGKPAWRQFAFPAAFLLFMVPPPPLLLVSLTTAMQQFVAVSAAWMLEIAGATVYREGYMVHLPHFSMEVGQACSGMRQLVTFAALGAAVGHLSRRGGWFTPACLTVALTAALAANLLRVLLTAAVLATAGPRWAAGLFHTLEGLLTFVLGTVLMLACCLAMANYADRRQRREESA